MELEQLLKVTLCNVCIYDINNDETLWKGWQSEVPQVFRKCRVVAARTIPKEVLEIYIEI